MLFNKFLYGIIFLPIIEIFIFIEVGSIIGTIPTILLTLTTAFYGAYLLKIGTFNNIRNVQNKIMSGEMPDLEIMTSMFNVLSAILLIFPGILTDLVGLVFLIKPVQYQLMLYMSKKRQNYSSGASKKSIIDVEYKKNDD